MIRALILVLAVIGAWSVLCFAIVTACIWVNQRAGRKRPVRDDVPVIGRGGWSA